LESEKREDNDQEKLLKESLAAAQLKKNPKEGAEETFRGKGRLGFA